MVEIRAVNPRDIPGGETASFGNPTISVKKATKEMETEEIKAPKPKKVEPKGTEIKADGELDSSSKRTGDIVEMCAFPAFLVDEKKNYYYSSQRTYKDTDFYISEEDFVKLKTLFTDIRSKFIVIEEDEGLVTIRTPSTTSVIYPKNCLKKTSDYTFEDLAKQNSLLLSFHFYPKVDEKRKFSEAAIKAILERKPWVLPIKDGQSKSDVNKQLLDFLQNPAATPIKIKLFGSEDVNEARPGEIVLLGRQLIIKPLEVVYIKDFDYSRITDVVRRGRIIGSGLTVVSVTNDTVTVSSRDAGLDETLGLPSNSVPVYNVMKFFGSVPIDWLPSETILLKRLKEINFKKAIAKIKDNNDKEVKSFEISAANYKQQYVNTMKIIEGMKNFDPENQLKKVKEIFNTDVDVTENGDFTTTINKLWFFGLQYTWEVQFRKGDSPVTYLKAITIPTTGKTYENDSFRALRNPHPHVNSSGTWCTGAVYEKISNALRAMDIYECVFITHNFLTQFNPWSPFAQPSSIFGGIKAARGLSIASPAEQHYLDDLIKILISIENEFASKRNSVGGDTSKFRKEWDFRKRFDEEYKKYMAKKKATQNVLDIFLPSKAKGGAN
jgi:hypothetical protein